MITLFRDKKIKMFQKIALVTLFVIFASIGTHKQERQRRNGIASTLVPATLIQQFNDYAADGPTVQQKALTLGAHHLVIVTTRFHNDNPDTITRSIADTAGNSWVTIPTHRLNTLDDGTAIATFYCFDSIAGATTISVTNSAILTDPGFAGWEFSGTFTASDPIDTAVVYTDADFLTPTNTQDPTSGNIIITHNCLLLVIEADENTSQDPGGYVAGHVTGFTGASLILGTSQPTHTDAVEWHLGLAAGTYSPSIHLNQQSSHEWTLQVIAFKLA